MKELLRVAWKFLKKYWELLLGILIGVFVTLKLSHPQMERPIKDMIEEKKKKIKLLEKEREKIGERIKNEESLRDKHYKKFMKKVEKIDKQLEEIEKNTDEISLEEAVDHIRNILEEK